MSQLITIGVILLLLAGVYWLWQIRRSRSRRGQSPSATRSDSTPFTAHLQPTVNPTIEQKLIGMLAGDRAAALRLVERARQQHPNKSAQWLWEKAITDLERDRQR